jgi:hypothetical protein
MEKCSTLLILRDANKDYIRTTASRLSGYQKSQSLLGVLVHSCNASTWEAEAGGLWVPGQPRLHNKTTLPQQINK